MNYLAPFQPTEAQWSGLARHLMMWMDMNQRYTPNSLKEHLVRSGVRTIPEWMANEIDAFGPDHSMDKGTRATLIYKAMLDTYRPVEEVKDAAWRSEQNLIGQIDRYGGILNPTLLEALERLIDVNDDQWHDRDVQACILPNLNQAIDLLFKLKFALQEPSQ